jgi:hypothetical protein
VLEMVNRVVQAASCALLDTGSGGSQERESGASRETASGASPETVSRPGVMDSLRELGLRLRAQLAG